MYTQSLIHRQEYIVVPAILFLVITLANLHAVFGLNILLLDDNARYFAFNQNAESSFSRSFLGLNVALKNIAIYLFGTYSAEAARAFLLFVYMIPLSILFYAFNRKVFNLSIWTSLASAAVINIIPRQYVIPAFLDGSYPLPGMIMILASLFFTHYFLESKRTNYALLLAASITWLLVCDLVGEMGIFLYPVVFVFCITANADLKRKAILIISTGLITAYRLYFYFETVGANPTNKPVSLSFSDIVSRIGRSFEWWLPFGKGNTVIIVLGAALVLLLAYALITIRKDHVNGHNRIRAIILYATWFICACAPFWFLSRYFSTRYFYIAYFGLTTIAFIALYEVFISRRKHATLISVASIVFIFVLYGIQRYYLNEEQVARWNRADLGIKNLFENETINDNTQIALVNIKNGTGGYIIWSSGYLQYSLKNRNIRGVMGNEMNFYDPFNLDHCGYSHKMSCLDPEKELIAYRQNQKYERHRMHYFLQWIEKGKRDSRWNLYQTLENNQLSVITSGTGLDKYIDTLSELALDPVDVLWGNYNDNRAVDAMK